MKDLFSGTPDIATPLNTGGGYQLASGSFNLKRSLNRKVKSRDDLDQPRKELFDKDVPPPEQPTTNSVDRYFGSFSIESKRHVWDLLQKHPQFGNTGNVRLNRVHNNTREVLPNDPIKLINNGGKVTYQ